VAEDVACYLAYETYDVISDGTSWLFRSGVRRREPIGACAPIIIADQSRKLVADVLRREMVRSAHLGHRRMLRTPLHRLLSRTLQPRHIEGRPHLFELNLLGALMGLTTFLLRRHPTYLLLSLSTSIYYAWVLQGAYEALMHERLKIALEDTLASQGDGIDTYESGEWDIGFGPVYS